MEKWSMLLCGLLIASGILSSQAKGEEYTKGEVKGLSVELAPDSIEVLGGNVTLYFSFDRNFSEFLTERTISVSVYHGNTEKKLHTENVQFRSEDRKVPVVLPCTVFDHPGLYRFKYRISNGKYAAFISKTLTLNWGDIRIESPTNHTALTRLDNIRILHNRQCWPRKSRDAVRLYYIKDYGERIFVDKKYVRKLSNRKKEPSGSWVRMVFPCRVFDTQGIYVLEYWAASANKTLSTSRALHVHWARPTLKPLASQIFPCKESFSVSIEPLKCQSVSRNDYVVLRDKFTETMVSQRPVTQDYTAVFFPCSSFKNYVDEYCFDYMAYSTLTKDKARVASECVQTHAPGTSNYGGWSPWSPWGFCSTSCGEGKQRRYRYCSSVRTSNNRKSKCTGNSLMSRSCALDPCPVSGSTCPCGCQLKEPEGMITSSPQLFSRVGSFSCTWLISLPKGSTVRLSFDALKLNGDSIIIRDGVDSSAPKITIIKDSNHKLGEPITSTGNNMYIFYKHNGDWINGTRRGFTASYRQVERNAGTISVYRRKKLGNEELIFLAVFIFAVIVFGLILFVVFTKIRRRHENLRKSASSGSSSTSECTLRSMGTPSPIDDDASSNEAFKGFETFQNYPRRSSHRKKTRRTEFLCDADRVPRCTCGEISELDSASGSNSASDFSPVRVLRDAERHVVLEEIPCECPDCLRFDRYSAGVSREFRAPEKKYYGDWMREEMQPHINNFHFPDERMYSDPCKSFV